MDTFEITIQRATDEGWPVVIEWSSSKTWLPVRKAGLMQFDQSALISQFEPRDYGTLLGQALFCDKVREVFVQARAESEDGLSVLLFVEDIGLRSLRWERLCAPLSYDDKWDFLSLNQRTPFSLYLPSATDRRFRPFGRRELRALIVAASPQGLEYYKLSHFDVNDAVANARISLDGIPCDVLATVQDAVGRPTLDAICEQITTTSYTLLHIICHGLYQTNTQETVLYLAGANNWVEPVVATRFLERLKRLGGGRGLPHFSFFAMCESASSQAEGALGGLAQRLVRDVGMPAVLAMTEKISISTTQALTMNFYRQLRKHGAVDLALAEACAGLMERSDIMVPALYSRLRGRPLFTDALDRVLNSNDIRYGLSRLKELFKERAPVLLEPLQKNMTLLQSSLDAAVDSNREVRSERQRGLEQLNQQCEEALGLTFHALALGENPQPYKSDCPFRGLYPFDSDSKQFFFGRENLIERLQQRLRYHPFLAVLGLSGSGKSSLVIAGLGTALQRSEAGLQLVSMTPSRDPLKHLQASLANINESQPYVLIVDQFEELFTHCHEEPKRRSFLQELQPIVKKQRVVITMRADFIAECARYPVLKALIQEHLELIVPMNALELRQAIEQQASAVGLRFDADLGSTILEDVEQEPAAMPLLQHAFLEVWKRRHGYWLRVEEYRVIGGIQQAIAQTADTFYAGLEPEEQNRMRQIFVRLTRPDVDAAPDKEPRDTRQRLWLEELVPTASQLEVTRDLVARLATARLVVTGTNGTVEVAHEALIRHWPRLRKWLNEERTNLYLREKIREASREWVQKGRPRALLYRGSQLREARTWARRSVPNQREVAFLRASNQYRVQFTASVFVVIVLILSLTGVAGWFLLQPDSKIVTNIYDSGVGSLRWSIENSPAGSTIRFNLPDNLPDRTIMLRSSLSFGKILKLKAIAAHSLTIKSSIEKAAIVVYPNASVVIDGIDFKNSTVKSKGANDPTSFITNSGALVLRNSTISGNTSDHNGGGITNHGLLTLENSTVASNNALSNSSSSSSGSADCNVGSGGGIASDGQLKLIHSSVVNNTAFSGCGGGIYTTSAFTMIENSQVVYNKATRHITENRHGYGIGGGICIFTTGGTVVEIDNSSISNNTADGGEDGGGWGGGIYISGTSLRLKNSIISNNTAGSGPPNNDPNVHKGSVGGGLYAVNSGINGIPPTITLIKSTVSDNTAAGSGRYAGSIGGGVDSDACNLTLQNSTISGNNVFGGSVGDENKASRFGSSGGGGLAIRGIDIGGNYVHSMLTLVNSTISDNKADSSGGGIITEGAQMDIDYSTIYGNKAASGGGIAVDNSYVASSNLTSIPELSDIKVRKSIFASNNASTGPNIKGTLTSKGYNLISDVSGTNFTLTVAHSTDVLVDTSMDLKIDPNLSGAAPQVHALFQGSPAIDRIPLNACYADGVKTDQRNISRPQGPKCDIGAYEYVTSLK